MGYEGDTCSFTCNTGYELTSSDTRTCQSDGSWSGSDDVCRRGMYINTYQIGRNFQKDECFANFYKYLHENICLRSCIIFVEFHE